MPKPKTPVWRPWKVLLVKDVEGNVVAVLNIPAGAKPKAVFKAWLKKQEEDEPEIDDLLEMPAFKDKEDIFEIA